ncbi:hypothetical protein CDD83_2837 [Cordyceps sp. RAO-2017]|nr:hypothetical protein CDD83_2837 [Cordyceps sp. RAO-2017]
MSTTPIKFDVPDGCRLFLPFPRLPAEIRHRIWELCLCEPGVNFVKLQVWENGWLSGRWSPRPAPTALDADAGRDLDDVELVLRDHDRRPRPHLHARLVSLSPSRRADASNYEQLHARLAVLSKTCLESAALARSLVLRPGVLRFDNGNVIALRRSPDLVFLEYLPPDLYHGARTLDVCFFCPGLDLVRRVAMRFSHHWSPRRTRPDCTSCGKPHDHTDPGSYPAHLYQFLARCLPSLEEFYFVDYFIVPRTHVEADAGESSMSVDGDDDAAPCFDGGESDGPQAPQPLQVFRAKNRRFREVGDGETGRRRWKMEPKVSQIRDWLRDRFVRYARTSHTSRHRSPERVRFGILACEWDVCVPESRGMEQQHAAPPQPRRRARTPPNRPSAASDDGKTTRVLNGSAAVAGVNGGGTRHPDSRASSSSVRSSPRGTEREESGQETGRSDNNKTTVYHFGADASFSFDFTFRETYGSTRRRFGR